MPERPARRVLLRPDGSKGESNMGDLTPHQRQTALHGRKPIICSPVRKNASIKRAI